VNHKTPKMGIMYQISCVAKGRVTSINGSIPFVPNGNEMRSYNG